MSLVLALTLAVQKPHIVEVIAPGTGRVVVQALVKLPEMGAADLAKAIALKETLLEGSRLTSRHALWAEATHAGSPPRVILMPDHLRIELAAPPGGLSRLARVLKGLLREPLLPPERVAHVLETLPFRRRPIWQVALWPEAGMPIKLARPEVLDLWRRAARADHVVLAVGGALEPGEAERAFEGLWDRVVTAPQAATPPDAQVPVRDTGTVVSVLELRGEPFSARLADLPVRILALFALGTGKTAPMTQLLREEQKLSYHQDAVLWPHALGFQPRLLVLRRLEDQEDGMTTLAGIRRDLLESVANWREVDRQRAVALAESTLTRGLLWNPLAFQPDGAIGRSFEDQLFLAAYWKLKTGEVLDEARLVRLMRLVRLEDLKEAAEAILANSKPIWIRGRQ
ncbi:MAG TPA: hypothetical protein VM328_13515 [Fimbriimonadaceae bacterium]|nr:hypothetical protein [Fimbriimonadaceae bacterium]